MPEHKPLAVDLYCGLGGWTDGLLAEGWDVIGFDNARHDYGDGLRYPAQLVLQDVLTLHGSQFRGADLIVGSSPCQEFSYRAMPWKRAKALPPPELGMALFHAQFRIQREACEAAGRHIPMVVENVKGAQPWVGRANWHYGSYYLWGDVPALMPIVARARKFNPDRTEHHTKNAGGSWFGVAHNKDSGHLQNPRDGVKVEGQDWSRYARTGEVSAHWNQQALKTPGAPHLRDGEPHTKHLTNPAEHGIKQHGSGRVWFDQGIAALPSGSSRRKLASAMIAKIPLPLSQHIARVYYPRRLAP